jgi:hypothetical protein
MICGLGPDDCRYSRTNTISTAFSSSCYPLFPSAKATVVSCRIYDHDRFLLPSCHDVSDHFQAIGSDSLFDFSMTPYCLFLCRELQRRDYLVTTTTTTTKRRKHCGLVFDPVVYVRDHAICVCFLDYFATNRKIRLVPKTMTTPKSKKVTFCVCAAGVSNRTMKYYHCCYSKSW